MESLLYDSSVFIAKFWCIVQESFQRWHVEKTFYSVKYYGKVPLLLKYHLTVLLHDTEVYGITTAVRSSILEGKLL